MFWWIYENDYNVIDKSYKRQTHADDINGFVKPNSKYPLSKLLNLTFDNGKKKRKKGGQNYQLC